MDTLGFFLGFYLTRIYIFEKIKADRPIFNVGKEVIFPGKTRSFT